MTRVDRLVSFDTETSSPDPETARVITAFLGVFDVQKDGWVEEHYWLLDPQVDIDPGATAVHGYDADDLAMAGTDAARGIFDITQKLDIHQRAGLPTVIYNARFDLTLMDREYRRHYPGGRPHEPARIIDPFVMDKAADTYRKGSRKLVDVAAHYGVPVEANAHDASADCLMAARLAVKLLQHRQFYQRDLDQIHDFQVNAAATQARGLAAYFRKSGKPDQAASVQEPWPLVPYPEENK